MADHVLTLVAAAGSEPLDADLIAEIGHALHRLGADLGSQRWLAPAEACDLEFGGLNDDQADAAARRVLAGRKIDAIAQPSLGRRKRLIVADMESTLIRNEMLDELAEFAGVKAEVAAITARAMNGELDFAGAVEARLLLLKGLPVEALETAAARIELMPGAEALIATMQANGAASVLVSGGFRFFTRKVARRLGIGLELGNELKLRGGKLTGEAEKPILGRQAKCETLIRRAAELKLPLAATLAVGDGANDLDMLLAAGLGVAFRAKPAVAAKAKWRVEHGDLTALLYAQGYRAEEILTKPSTVAAAPGEPT